MEQANRNPSGGRSPARQDRPSSGDGARGTVRALPGPKTPEGKARVSQNARKHGLFSREILLPDEDGQALAQLAAGLRADLQPVGELESLLVDQIVSAAWRLRRLGRVEAGIFTRELYGILRERARSDAARYERNDLDALIENLRDGTVTITDEEKHQEASSRASEATALQQTETGTFGLAFTRGAGGADGFSKLSRYEATIERSLYRALHELQRRQQARRGGHVPPPVAVDVDVSGVSGETR